MGKKIYWMMTQGHPQLYLLLFLKRKVRLIRLFQECFKNFVAVFKLWPCLVYAQNTSLISFIYFICFQDYMKSYKKLSFIVPKYLVSILVSSNLMLCGSFIQCIMISYFLFSIQDVWTELGRPCGIHQKQVLLSFHKSVDDLLRILDKFLIFYIIESGILAVICKLPEDGFPFKLYICLIQCLLSIYYLCYLLMVLMEGDFACNTG